MNYCELYEFRFNELLQKVRHNRNHALEYYKERNPDSWGLFEIGTEDYRTHKAIITQSESWILYTINRIIKGMLDLNGIAYIVPLVHKHEPTDIDFIIETNGKRVGYSFYLNRHRIGLAELRASLKRQERLDSVRIFFIRRITDHSQKDIEMLNSIEEKDDNSFIQFTVLKDFFDMFFGQDQYSTFLKYVNDFNERARSLIGFETIITPTDEAVQRFKQEKAEMLRQLNYDEMFLEPIHIKQKELLRHNFLERKLFEAMTGEADFADSFISSEWYYGIHMATDALDQTGIVAGYLKSVEQLLWAIIKLSRDKGQQLVVGHKGEDEPIYWSDNETRIDTTLGSLKSIIDANSNILNVAYNVKKHIVWCINDWRFKQRNGYFHKENLHNSGRVAEIRQRAIYLYYLILGGSNIKDDELGLIGMVHEKDDTNIVLDLEYLYSQFAQWALPVITFDVEATADTISFTAIERDFGHWELNLFSSKKSKDSESKWSDCTMSSTVITGNYFRWHDNSILHREKDMITGFVERMRSENSSVADKLRHRHIIVSIMRKAPDDVAAKLLNT